jgi:hypothetical protein
VTPKKEIDHILPHRAWKSLKVEGEFTPEEHDHILHCPQCLELFLLCCRAETFGAVLKQMNKVGNPAA